MKTLSAILIKQCKDSLHNLPSLMVMLIYPAVAWIMITTMRGEEAMTDFFVPMFAAMHCSFSPITLSSNILSEEKEKGTLRSLVMAGVSGIQYLISLSVFVIVFSMLTGSAFLLMGDFDPQCTLTFAGAMLAGVILSTLAGLCVGIRSKNVSGANGIAVPVGLVLALLPMLGQFNSRIEKAAGYVYSGQISGLMQGGDITSKTVAVLCAYFVGLWGLLILLFRRNKLD
ncbi:MAG: hypothetical protein IIU00_03305 [Clostridia bacterium]|nr:hypothetical protein [Clostridia bacterium]